MRRMELGALVALGIAVAGGLIWVGQISQSVVHLEQSARELKEDQASAALTSLKEEVEKIRVDVEDIAGDRFSKFPVGAIIPFVGKKKEIDSLVRWKICDGSILEGTRYRDSPFYNQSLPELDDVFLRATLSNDNLLKPGGSDKHSHPQPHTHSLPHTHSGQTSTGMNANGPKRDHHHEGGVHTHKFTTSSQSDVDTTPSSEKTTGEGVAIPRYISVFYIIKVI